MVGFIALQLLVFLFATVLASGHFHINNSGWSEPNPNPGPGRRLKRCRSAKSLAVWTVGVAAIDSITKIAFGSGIICYNSCCQCKLKLCHAASQLAGAGASWGQAVSGGQAAVAASSSSSLRLGSFTSRSRRRGGGGNKFPLLVSLTFYFLRFFVFLIFSLILFFMSPQLLPSAIKMLKKISKHKWIFKLPSWQTKIEKKLKGRV